MRFSIEHTFATTLDRLEGLLDEPDFYPRMSRALPGLASIELLAREETNGVLRRRVRYTPRAEDVQLPSFGRGLVTPEMLIWTEESAFHRADHRIDYRIQPNLPEKWRDRFDSSGSFTFNATPRGVLRRVEG